MPATSAGMTEEEKRMRPSCGPWVPALGVRAREPSRTRPGHEVPGSNLAICAGRPRASATRIALTRRCSKNCCHNLPDPEPDLGPRAFLHHDGAGHSGADQHAGWYVRQVDADRNALGQSDPGECGIDGREEL